MSTLKIAIHGAAGRMGQRLVAAAVADPELTLVAALDRAGHPKLGADVGVLAGIEPQGVALADTLPPDVTVDALVDFSLPQGTEAMIELCTARKIPLVVATTGLNPEQVAKLDVLAESVPVVYAPNMSMAVNLVMKLAQTAARALARQDADVEILERHHRFKVDSPSGTALKFGELIAREMGITQFRDGRSGEVGARPHDEIAYHAIRTGDNPGEHTVVFGMMGETVEVTVRCSSRDCYAHGAFAAAKFLRTQTSGRFDMFDVLGL